MESLEETKTPETDKPNESFKKPIFVGKIGRLPRKLQKTTKPEVDSVVTTEESFEINKTEDDKFETPPVQVTESTLPYTEPSWSGLPQTSGKSYGFEVLKNGSIIENIDLMSKPFWVFGRLPSCDICMQHPTISRYHAVLQYRSEENETNSPGFYLYDLNSTHGTFLNKNKLKSKVYVRIQVGHLLKLGCSSRSYILNGPENDAEEESPLSVTELKQKRLEDIRKREEAEKEAILEKERKEEELRRKYEERGVDWGLGEDAEEEKEANLSENPYAQTSNEELYLDNPKKALRGFFEREGLDLEYDCSEQGMGQFLCKVQLPVDDDKGRPIFAEVLHKGKKKEAVIQCALEACRILDRFGLLRQATHESRKRKPKNWEDNDYYDSDDDTYLDRTGAIEKKREMRMKAKAPQKAATYESLLEDEKKINLSIQKLQNEIAEAINKLNSQQNLSQEEDSLDSFMKELKQSKINKQSINKLKSELVKLKQNHLNVIKLINIAKPTNLPALTPNYEVSTKNSNNSSDLKRNIPMIGKLKKIKIQLPTKLETEQNTTIEMEDEDKKTSEINENTKHNNLEMMETTESGENVKNSNTVDGSNSSEIPTSNSNTEEMSSDKKIDEQEMMKKKKNNQRRIQQRQQNAEIEKQKGYQDDATKEDYNMWVPPSDQSGDGKTKLNEKYGY